MERHVVPLEMTQDFKVKCAFCKEGQVWKSEIYRHLEIVHRISEPEVCRCLAECHFANSTSFHCHRSTSSKDQKEINHSSEGTIIYGIIERIQPDSNSSRSHSLNDETTVKDYSVVTRYRCKSCSFCHPSKSIVIRSHGLQKHRRLSKALVQRLVPVVEPLQSLSSSPTLECGSLVFSKLKGFPWWPSVILQPPDELDVLDSYYKRRKYHVGFFDEGTMTRNWIHERLVVPYSNESAKSKQPKNPGQKYLTALEWLKKVQNWTNEERRLDLAFVRNECVGSKQDSASSLTLSLF